MWNKWSLRARGGGMSRTYAIADLHGRFDLLTAAFDAIVKHAAERSFKIITLGDYVDRGPQSRQIIDHLMAAQEIGVSLICLKGKDHIVWLENLPLMHIDAHRIFVHAGVDRFKPLDQQDSQVLLWKLYDGNDEGGHDRRHVVHGHHQFEDGPIKHPGRTDLDTFAWYTGRLAVGVFNDEMT